MKQVKKVAAVLLAAGAIAGSAVISGCGGAAASVPDTIKVQNADNNVISVSSREQVKVEPDMAEIVYSVYSQATDAQTCQTQNGTELNKVLELLESQGVETKSIQTSNYGLNPIYDWEDGKTISGYEMTTRVTVSDIPMDQVGQLLSDSVDAGINSIESVTYLCSSYDESYQKALEKAVAAAKVKAQAMAEAGGCKLGKIVHIQEYGGSQEARYNGYNSRAAGAAKQELSAVAMDMGVMPGQVEIEADITVEFALE